MKVITALTNPYIKSLSKLKIKKYRESEKKFLIEGYHLVKEAQAAHRLQQVLITDEKDYLPGIENILVNRDIILKLANTKNPQNIIGICEYHFEKKISGQRFLLLDGINDPGNLGTLIRSALGFNIDQIILGDNCVDLYNDKVIRATQGAFFKINLIQKPLLEAIKILKKQNVYLIGTSLKNAQPLKTLSKVDKYAIILGNEALGISDEILNLTDINIKIEISPHLESLNVAIAGAIVMYHLGVENE